MTAREIFGCRHRRTTFPMTLDRAEGAYIRCLDCCAKLAYDFERMEVGKEISDQERGRNENQLRN
jgi:hypothetical protein